VFAGDKILDAGDKILDVAMPLFLRWRQDGAIRCAMQLRMYRLMLYAVLAAVLAVVLVFSSSVASTSDRLVEIGDVLAAGTLGLALLAGYVAVQAYKAATGLPDLRIQVSFEYSEKNAPAFEADARDDGSARARPFKQTSGRIVIQNLSDYSPRNPSVVLRRLGCRSPSTLSAHGRRTGRSRTSCKPSA
jgi:hypothetical protein